jgi:hypothetical protein
MARDIRDGSGEGPGTGTVAPSFPSTHLPPVTYKDMPEPLPCARSSDPG